MPETISVVIPTYQRRELVREAIESVQRQSRPADEIIVVDDGSTDGTSEAIGRAYGTGVRLIRQERRGVSAARNAGVTVASGSLVAFLDDDDLWLPDHLATTEAIACMYPDAVLVSTGWAGLGEDDARAAVCADLAAPMVLGFSPGVGQPSAITVRRDAYTAVGGCDERMRYFEDWDLQLQLSLLGPVAYINGRTFVRREQLDSLWREAVGGAHQLDAWRFALPKVLIGLGRSPRADAAALRRALAARIARDAAITALAGGGPARVVRKHLIQVCWLSPFPGSVAAWILGALPVLIPDWHRRRSRVRTLAMLTRAWPERMSAEQLRLLRALFSTAIGMR